MTQPPDGPLFKQDGGTHELFGWDCIVIDGVIVVYLILWTPSNRGIPQHEKLSPRLVFMKAQKCFIHFAKELKKMSHVIFY